jgi:endonuclease/exonuclease/phosphatase family metal-dependent hydrolase
VDIAYNRTIVEDVIRLRRRIIKSGVPQKVLDKNLLVGTWNLRGFSKIHPHWEENPGSPKRNLRALVYISEIIRLFDVIAIQEVKRDTSGIRILVEKFLGSDWGLIISDVTAGDGGNSERLAYIYDKRRVQPSGLAGEIVLSPTQNGNPTTQFYRTPYIVGFTSATESFALLTAHIKYGSSENDRIPEIESLANYISTEIRDRAKAEGEEKNLIVLGDFNIDKRGDNPLFKAFISTGLVVPSQLNNLKTTFNTNAKFYDQIAWFMGDNNLLESGKAGVVDFVDAVFKELPPLDMSFRLSDHFPLWVEFLTDRSNERMAVVLGKNPAMPDPFSDVLD